MGSQVITGELPAGRSTCVILSSVFGEMGSRGEIHITRKKTKGEEGNVIRAKFTERRREEGGGKRYSSSFSTRTYWRLPQIARRYYVREVRAQEQEYVIAQSGTSGSFTHLASSLNLLLMVSHVLQIFHMKLTLLRKVTNSLNTSTVTSTSIFYFSSYRLS